MSNTVSSFDVFDTVLTRAVGSPAAVFVPLGRKLQSLSLIDCSPEAFARARADAERRAFVNAGGLDSKVTLKEIYTELIPALRLDINQLQNLMEQEMALETQLLRLVPRAKKLVDDAREHNLPILYVSDKYLGKDYIEDKLTQHGLFEEGDKCYVSSEYAKSKHTGSLFREVARQEGIDPARLVHAGNNAHADVKVAQRVGVQTRPFPQGNLNRYEEILETAGFATEGLSSVMAGAARLARLSVEARDEKEQQLRDVAASVGGPVLTGFVLWVLRRAEKLGIKRLYFVSRDGQILLEIANRLKEQLGCSCEFRYLYGSRQAWMLPSIINSDPDQLIRALYLEAHFISIHAAFDRVGIHPEEIGDKLISLGFSPSTWNENLIGAQREIIKKFVLDDEFVQNLIIARAAQNRKIMIKYLDQEGMLDDIKFGIIDLGISGTLHCALTEVLLSVEARTPVSFYLGLKNAKLTGQYSAIEGYFFDKRQNTGFEIPGLVSFLEMVCSGDHGSVQGYEEVGGRVEPVLTEKVNHKVMDWGYEKLRESICSFAGYLLVDKQLVNPWTDVRAITLKTFRAFWYKPTYAEARAWGSFLMEDGWGNRAEWLKIADAYDWMHLPGIIKTKQFQLRKHWWAWGSIALTPAPLQQILKSLQLAKDVADYGKPRVIARVKSLLRK